MTAKAAMKIQMSDNYYDQYLYVLLTENGV